MSYRLLLSFLLCYSCLLAQTGPAGIGNSSNNVLWLKANAGTSTTVDGTQLSTWSDQSGNAIDVGQSTTARQPLFRTNIMNGYPAIEFDNNATSGQNDMLSAPDNSLLDNTTGYTFFIVTRMKDLNGNARSIISKRTTIDTDEAFMLFFYTGNHFYTDIDGLGNRFATPAPAFTTNTNYLLNVLYDGSLVSTDRVKVYKEESLKATGSESSSLVPDKISQLVIGATHATDNRPYSGYIPEIIIYRTALNDASRIIVNNYLSSKYDLPLDANDKYQGDIPVNGNFDHQVAGLGREANGQTISFEANTTGGLAMSINSGLDIGDYVLVGNDGGSNFQNFSDVGGMTGTLNARWQRAWYADVTDVGTAMNLAIEFDMSDGGMPLLLPGTATDYVLLFRNGQSGSWTELATANSTPGDKVRFNAVPMSGDGYYTVGTKNAAISPLPVSMSSFDAACAGDLVRISWSTLSESGNKEFRVEKSMDAKNFETIAVVPGENNSTELRHYESIDKNPEERTYYRLLQVDMDGRETLSGTISAGCPTMNAVQWYPNPAGDHILLEIPNGDVQVLEVYSSSGQRILSEQISGDARIDLQNHSKGIYLIKLLSLQTGKVQIDRLIKN